jgi:NAD(P)H-dependent flavin oxidoreductase YrpB (nitropropane dioxygenase family)
MLKSALAPATPTPWLIQGGMGIAISNWTLARAVSSAGQLGVVSGTAIDSVFVRRLQDTGVDPALRSVLDRFPVPSIVDDVLRRFGAARRKTSAPYKNLQMLNLHSKRRSLDVIVLAAFTEVALAKMGHGGVVGMNLLTKVQLPTAAALCGAILAGVDYVMMGAGVPTHIPGVLEGLSLGRRVTLPLSVAGSTSEDGASTTTFDPTPYLPSHPLRRPKFMGIVSSHVLATALARRSNGPVDGFVIERPSAGGHNAPPRGRFDTDDAGGPRYGERDEVSYEALSGLHVPFWIGGGVTSAQHVRDALSVGASGVQVGTLFAYCTESGMDPDLRRRVLDQVRTGAVSVATSLRASSTGYPFKVVSVAGTVSEPDVYLDRARHCDLGYLREAFVSPGGDVGYRCAAEPVPAFLRKGGSPEATVECRCLCNALMSTCGLGQVRPDGRREPPIVTSGDHLSEVAALLNGSAEYCARDVIDRLSPGGAKVEDLPRRRPE